jgi:hypothetical protein
VKKLLQLKQWLTVEEAARHLGTLFGEDVIEADVLRLALDGHLTLSVNFVNHAYGRCGSVVSIEDAKRQIREFGEKSPGGVLPDEVARQLEDMILTERVKYEEQPVVIDGIWDLTMEGAEVRDVEGRYQELTGGPGVAPVSLEGPELCRDDGTYCRVMAHFSDNEYIDPKSLRKPYDHVSNFYPAAGLPADSVLVVRTSSLHALQARLSEPDQKIEKPIERRERSTLLAIVAALCELAKIDVTKPSAAAAVIESQTVRMGARVAARTIENHLKLIPEALEGRSG